MDYRHEQSLSNTQRRLEAGRPAISTETDATPEGGEGRVHNQLPGLAGVDGVPSLARGYCTTRIRQTVHQSQRGISRCGHWWGNCHVALSIGWPVVIVNATDINAHTQSEC